MYASASSELWPSESLLECASKPLYFVTFTPQLPTSIRSDISTMRTSIFITTFLTSLALAAPIGFRAGGALVTRDGPGSTSTTADGGSGPLSGLLVGGVTLASEDGSTTSNTSSSECNLLECTSSASAAGPNGTDSSTSTGGPLSGVTIGRRALLQ